MVHLLVTLQAMVHLLLQYMGHLLSTAMCRDLHVLQQGMSHLLSLLQSLGHLHFLHLNMDHLLILLQKRTVYSFILAQYSVHPTPHPPRMWPARAWDIPSLLIPLPCFCLADSGSNVILNVYVLVFFIYIFYPFVWELSFFSSCLSISFVALVFLSPFFLSYLNLAFFLFNIFYRWPSFLHLSLFPDQVINVFVHRTPWISSLQEMSREKLRVYRYKFMAAVTEFEGKFSHQGLRNEKALALETIKISDKFFFFLI